MFSHAFLEDSGGGHLRREEQLLRLSLEKIGVPTTLYTAKSIRRGRLPLGPDSFVSGDVDSIIGAMRQLRVKVPQLSDYPEVLLPYLSRRVWRSSLSAVEQNLFEGKAKALFVKPAERKKAFTGRILESWDDLRSLGGVSRSQKVWCSEAVEWRSEYRVYICRKQIVGVDHYRGDSSRLDMRVVARALSIFSESDGAPTGYAMDFGVLDTGTTALVEVNDGFSLGAYAIAAEPYSDLVFTRWREILSYTA
jgi:hypothetical protein